MDSQRSHIRSHPNAWEKSPIVALKEGPNARSTEHIHAKAKALLFKIQDVHQDDVHCLLWNGSKIISGSKDTNIKIWSTDFNVISVIPNERVEGEVDYERWVTAIHSFSDGSWVAGDRHGFLRRFNAFDENFSSTQLQIGKHVSKARNANRIACIAAINDTQKESEDILVGVATSVQVRSRDTLEQLSNTLVSNNDWVYCIKHLRDSDYLFVIGASLEIWSHRENNTFFKKTILHKELKEDKSNSNCKPQRPLISAIEYLDQSTLAMVDFSGRVKIVDLESKKLLFNYKGHMGRAWAVKSCAPQLFATAADDACVKLWDSRQRNNVASFENHAGRVSNILDCSNSQIVVSSCPNNLSKTSERASFSVWDCRL